MKRWYILLLIFALVGVLDSGYLSFEHYQNVIPPCSVNSLFGDCGKVLKSEYSVIFGVPLALIGLIHYSILISCLSLGGLFKKRQPKILAFCLICLGFLSSLYFVYLQFFIVKAICIFCMVSAATSTLLFILSQVILSEERKRITIFFLSQMYQHILKPLFFMLPPELIHEHMTKNGQVLGKSNIAKSVLSKFIHFEHPSLKQEIAGITFNNPIGLAAGFDYEARLTQILPSIGFGFQSVGTITNNSYQGNPSPMLGRLPKSQSLMVNKGFKNLGAKKTIGNLSHAVFNIPVGISIGRTNSKSLQSQKESIEDIIQSFKYFEQSSVRHSYYELNISCPNLFGNITFYPKKNLEELLSEVDLLQIKKPIFIKMPIELANKEILEMLDVISCHSPTGVIFGNLQKDRKHSALYPDEVAKYSVGYFSGKPTFERSNELIKLTHKYFKEDLVIIGCGGVFTAEDAYLKIKLGASLVQLITGMIFKGPQLIAEINLGLVDLLKRDGFTDISQAIGSQHSN